MRASCRVRTALAFLIALALLPLGAARPAAQELDAPPFTETGRDYAETAAWEGIQTHVRYPVALDPMELADPEKFGEIEIPEVRPAARSGGARERWTWAIVIGAIVLLIVVIAIYYGGGISVSFRRTGDRRRDEEDEASDVIAREGGLQGFLDRLRAMGDRPRALYLLIQGALERAGEMTEQRVLRSQTAREVMRRLPGEWPHRDALGRIVGVEEVVQFGGRPLSEPVFEECLALAEPLFAEGRRR